jgi:molybdopterin molybdotransferase
MLSLEEAKSRILAALPVLPLEELHLASALGRFLAADISSPIDLPPFDNSAMDGYAVRSEDLKKASAENPVSLKLTGKIGAGESGELAALHGGESVRLFTGSPLPPGADAVVMQEDVRTEKDNVVFIESVRPFENVRLKGEDVRKGSLVLSRGSRLNATRRSLVAACGLSAVPVRKQAAIALIATGNELREPGEIISPGQIYESNRTLIGGLLDSIASVHTFPIVPDDLKKTTAVLQHAFSTADLVITTGGVSVGEFDFLKDAFVHLGGKIDLWRIAIRPGKPFVFGTLGGKHLFGLPGNPVSALVTFLVLVRPAILKMSGASNIELPTVEGELAEDLVNDGDRRHFMRVRWEMGRIHRGGPQASHRIANLAEANGLVDVPPETRLLKGSKVFAQLWDLPES